MMNSLLEAEVKEKYMGTILADKRIQPNTQGTNVLIIVFAIGAFFLGWVMASGQAGLKGFIISAIFIIGGFVLAVIFANDLFNPRSKSNKFRNSNLIVKAESVRHRWKIHTASYGDKYYKYFLTIRFDTEEYGVQLEAEVAKYIYDLFPTGSELKVRYCTSDPRIALLEGEKFEGISW